LRAHEGSAEPAETHTVGSEAWAAAVMRDNADFWSTVGEWRLQSGNTSYDDLILQYGTPYTRFRMTGDISHLSSSFDQILNTIRYNIPLLTTDAIHTDRIYISPHRSGADDQIKAMITGDQSPENSSPYTAVTWENTGNTLTVLVLDHGPEKLAADVYSYASEPKSITIKPWQLINGTYTLTINGINREIIIDERGQPIPVKIEPRELVRLSIEKK
jgi:hypothetical protein